MKKIETIIAIIVVGIVGFVGFNLLSQKTPNQENVQNLKANTNDSMVEENFDSTTPPAQNPQTAEKYIIYSPTAISEATKDGGKALLFFHANWCPTCKAAEKDILSNIEKIPDNLTIVKTDYDEYTDLKKKYNVTYQHTFVQVDSNGEMITSWNGGETETILQRIK